MVKKIITLLLIIAAFISLVVHSSKMDCGKKDEMIKNQLIAAHLYDSLSTSIKKPITISQTISIDSFLINFLNGEEKLPEKEAEKVITAYLTKIRDEFGYLATFIVSHKTKRYYTPNGISKVMNPMSDPYDVWYKLFVDSGKTYDLDTDRDQTNDYRWVVFINFRITGANGELLGVCGVGVFMDDLQNLVSSTEKEFGVKINLIDPEGLVQVDSNSANIENAFIHEAIADKAGADEFTYTEKKPGVWRMTRYMEDLEWFLVVQNFGDKTKSSGHSSTSLILAYIFLALLFIATIITGKKDRSHHFEKENFSEDSLTHLPNRNYLKTSFGEMGIFNTTRYKTLVMFDIDKFKIENETKEGDKILLSIVEYTKELIGENGIMFRWAGDEFVIFYEADLDEAEKQFKSLCATIKESLDVTISVGIASVNLSKSIKNNYHRAVKLCYEVKIDGGNGVRVEK